MKRILAVVALALVLVMALSSCGGARYAMGTGGTGGTYYAFGAVLGKQIEASTDFGCVAVSTDGSKANILGIKQGESVYVIANGKDEAEAIEALAAAAEAIIE